MLTTTSQERHLAVLSRIRRVHGQPGDRYELIFLDQHDRIIVPLTEWYLSPDKVIDPRIPPLT